MTFDYPINAGKILFGNIHVTATNDCEIIRLHYTHEPTNKAHNEVYGKDVRPMDITALVEHFSPELWDSIQDAVNHHAEEMKYLIESDHTLNNQ